MITKDYVSRETYKLLKEKGYDGEFKTCYDTEGYTYPAIHLYDAMKWLREVHRIEIHIVLSELNADNSRKYMFDTFSSDVNKNFDSVQKEGLNSYEEACEAAIKYCLKNLI